MNNPSADIPLAIIDAFVEGPHSGNPAAICPLPEFLPDGELQAMAAQHNLSETAFVVGTEQAGHFHLRWFTPEVEVPLCGHATLAAAHYLLEGHISGEGAHTLYFETHSGSLTVRPKNRLLWMDFPVRPVQAVLLDRDWCAHFPGLRSAWRNTADYLLLEVENAQQVHDYRPDAAFLGGIDAFGIMLTAPGGGDGVDFVSRFFAPRAGILEDPVTGSAHCSLFPFWTERLGREHLVARQVSKRGGRVEGELRGDRVLLGGHCRTYARGRILRG